MRSEEEIRRVRNLYLNDVLDQINRGGRPRKSQRTDRILVLNWILEEVQDLDPK